MNRKLLAIFALLLVAVSVSAVSALDSGDITSDDDATAQDEKVTIDGIDFNIPAKFKEQKGLALNGEKNETSGVKYTMWGKTYTKGGDIISIGVATYDGFEIDDTMPSFIGGAEKTINGVDGYEYNVEPFDGFTYAKDGKLIIISVTDANLLDEVVLK